MMTIIAKGGTSDTNITSYGPLPITSTYIVSTNDNSLCNSLSIAPSILETLDNNHLLLPSSTQFWGSACT